MSGCLLISILDPKISFTEQEGIEGASTENIFGGQTPLLTPYDLKRLESYSNNLVDYHLVRSFSLPFL
jgi:N-acetyltransferase 10